MGSSPGMATLGARRRAIGLSLLARDASSLDWWTLLCLAVTTGLRRSEILNLRVRDLDLNSGALVVQKGKSTRARRVVPVSGEALNLMRAWIGVRGLTDDDRVFAGVDAANLRYAWERIRETAGVQDLRFHDLRHTYAVHCAKAGMPIVELQHRLGHATITMTQRYAVYSPALTTPHFQDALAKMGLDGVDGSTPHIRGVRGSGEAA